MWSPPSPGNNGERVAPMARLVAVAVDRDKGSQIALKWDTDNLVTKGQTTILVHVKQCSNESVPQPVNRPTPIVNSSNETGEWDAQTKEVFLPFCVFCTRKDVSFMVLMTLM